MKAHLLYRDRDFDLQQKLPANEPALTQDLELNTLFRAMAGGDEFLFYVAKQAVLSGLQNDLKTIPYRPAVLKDCLRNESAVREIYGIAVEAIEMKRTHWLGVFSRYPSGILYEAVKLLQMLMGVLAKLKRMADEVGRARSPLRAANADLQTSISERRARSDAPYQFESDGFKTLFAMLKAEFAEDYFAAVEAQLKELQFKDGVLVSAELGQGNHLYEFAHAFWEDKMNNAVFLRAERRADGQRTFKLLPGEPLETSFSADLYREMFEGDNEREVLTQ